MIPKWFICLVVFPPEFTVKVMSEDETVMTSAKASHLSMRLLPKSMASDSVKPITLVPDVKKKGVTEGKFLFTYVALVLLVLTDTIGALYCMSPNNIPPFDSTIIGKLKCLSKAPSCLAIERARVRIPRYYRFEDWPFSFSPLTPLLTQPYKWVPG